MLSGCARRYPRAIRLADVEEGESALKMGTLQGVRVLSFAQTAQIDGSV